MHLHILNSFTLAFSAGYFANSELDISVTGAWGVGIDAAVVFMLLVAYSKTKPFREEHSWRYNIQRMLLLTTLLLALLAICGTLAAEKKGEVDAGGELVNPKFVRGLEQTSKFVSFAVLLLMNVMFLMLCKSFWEVVVLEKRELDVEAMLKTANATKKTKWQQDKLPKAWSKGALLKAWSKKGANEVPGRALGGGALGGGGSEAGLGDDGVGRTSQFTGSNPMHPGGVSSSEPPTLTLSDAEARAAARLAKLALSVAPSGHAKRSGAGARGGAGVTLASSGAAEEAAEKAVGRPTEWEEIDFRNVALRGSVGGGFSHHRTRTSEESAASRAQYLGRSVDKLAGRTSAEKLEASASGGGRIAANAAKAKNQCFRSDSEILLFAGRASHL